MFEKIYPYFAITVGILILGIIGKIEYEDEKAVQAKYCADVFSEKIPDYKHVYDNECFVGFPKEDDHK